MPEQVPAVRATERARAALAALSRTAGDLVIVQSSGCCDGSAPMVLPAADFPLTPADIQIGDIDGVPVVIQDRDLNAWKHGDLELDVAPGYADGLSFAAGEGLHFVSHVTACIEAPDQKEEK